MRLVLPLFLLGFAAPLLAEMKSENWGTTTEGEPVVRYTLTNAHGIRAGLITWGAALVELSAPDREGRLADVTLGFDSLEPYLQPHPFFGSIAGRYANRIAKGRFTLDGKEYALATNDGENHLHGGRRGFDKRNWHGEPIGSDAVRFTYISADGEEGYPGKLTVSVTYRLSDDDKLSLEYEAETDAPTVLNLTNHAYWNLAGKGDIRSHELWIKASRFTPVDGRSIPTGEVRPVAGSPMDFTTAKPIGRDLPAMSDAPGGGFDHNWVIDREGAEPQLAAELYELTSGRLMRVLTTEPGIQFYTGNYLKAVSGKAGQVYEKHAGLCLETQHFPDSPNHAAFPTTVLRPGEKFRSVTVYQFAVRP